LTRPVRLGTLTLIQRPVLTQSSQNPQHQPFLEQNMAALRERFAPLNRHYEGAWTDSFVHMRCWHTSTRRSSMQPNVHRPKEFRVGTFFASSPICPVSLLVQKTSRLGPSASVLAELSIRPTKENVFVDSDCRIE